jgi:NtrC-family two-component system response regulator AlgB
MDRGPENEARNGLPPLHVLVVDDEKNIRTTLTACLEAAGCTAVAVGNTENALTAVERERFDVAFLDLRLEGEQGMDLIPKLLVVRPGLSIVVITAYSTVESAVESIKKGAADYLPKPFTPAQIRHQIDQIARRRALADRVAEVESRLAAEVPEADLATHSASMQAVLDTLGRAAASDAPILLRGENGTGKGVLARALHAKSARSSRPIVSINCPTLSEELLASELFGHARGAFTGAVRDQAGRVEAAEGGTLFLDEIGEISPALQAKLLRFVQEKQYERVGETRTRRADVRLLAASNRDLEQDVAGGRFRQDLLFRLNVIELRVPALRDRREDILPLARRFLSFFARAAGRATPELSPESEAALIGYTWPGNVRELRNAMERALILWPHRLLTPEALPERIAAKAAGRLPWLGGDFTLEEIEREQIFRVTRRAPTLEEAARILGIDSSTLWRKRKKSEEG